MIERLRGLGLTIKEIQHLARVYEQAPDRVEPELDRVLDAGERRVASHIAELQALQQRIRAYRHENRGALSGKLAADAAAPPARSG